MFRALESAGPQGVRRFRDPLAVCFLGRSMRTAVAAAKKSRMVHAMLARFIDRRWPGARVSGVARTIFIDNALREALRSDVEQVVILGAGYDSRAYRIDEMKRIAVFEVDRAETQRHKRERLLCALGSLPRHVEFVEMDFARDALSRALTSAGFAPERKTFFIWEGVTHYLELQAVDATMRFVGGCAAGSTLAFTYVHRGLLDGSAAFTISPNVVRYLDDAGERWKSGFYPGELREYLRARGLRLIEDLGAIEYGARCMGAESEQMRGYEFYHIALARVGLAGGANCQK